MSGEIDDFKFLRHNKGMDCRDLGKYLKNLAFYGKNIKENHIIYEADLMLNSSK